MKFCFQGKANRWLSALQYAGSTFLGRVCDGFLLLQPNTQKAGLGDHMKGNNNAIAADISERNFRNPTIYDVCKFVK